MVGRRGVAALVVFVAAVTLAIARPDACTTFCVRVADRVLFGRNYDFEIGQGLVIVNPGGLQKRGFLDGGPAWRARHGSVTFNQFGREFPMGGMNEAGLVVELMWHEGAQYPSPDARSPVGVLEWIQYQLDTASTVEEVLGSDRRVRISGRIPLHYLVSDTSGRVTTVEFLRGQLHARSGESLPVSVLANDTYADSLAFWSARQGRAAGGSSSHARFARAADAVSRMSADSSADPIDKAFRILSDVAQRSTRWSVVYDQTNREIAFRTDVHPMVRTIRFGGVNFECSTPARLLDVHVKRAGDVTSSLEPYTEQRNRTLVVSSYRGFSGTRDTPDAEIERTVAHGSAANCAS